MKPLADVRRVEARPLSDRGRRFVARLAVVLGVAAASFATRGAVAAPPGTGAAPAAHAKSDDLARAHTLDKDGARAYAEGRYADAIRDFDEAYRLGGPAFELWNVAKCHLRLDQPEQAAGMLERYLAVPNLPKEDRDEATSQLDALKKRPSTVSVTSTPPGAQVSVDGKAIDGKTPLSVSVPPGTHTVTVSSLSTTPVTKQIEAHWGHAIAVDAAAPVVEERPPPPPNPYEVAESHPLVVRGALGIMIPRYGTVGGNVGASFDALVTYRLAELDTLALSVGGLVSIVGDSWDNRTGDPNTPPGNCAGALHSPQSATAVSFFGVGSASLPIASRFRATALGGVGLGGLFVTDVGGDVFIPSCTTSPGVRPALLLGTELDYALTPSFRLSAFPLTWQFQPAFEGTRASPRDASGTWMRFGIGLGAGVDL